MSSTHPILEGRSIDQWKVAELREELRRRKLKTGGLKDELVRRLENELEVNVISTIGVDSTLQSEVLTKQQAVVTLLSDELEKDITPALVEENVVTNEELNKGMDTDVTHELERSVVFVSENIQDVTSRSEHMSDELKVGNTKIEINDDNGNTNEEMVEGLKVVSCVESSRSDIKQENEVTVTVETETLTETKVSVISSSDANLLDDSARDESSDLKAKLENGDSGADLSDTKVDISDPNNQVSEVSPVFGFLVKSESVTINENIELKDNIIADDVKLEPYVKPELVYPSSSIDIPDNGKSHPMDVEETQAIKVSVEETGDDNPENVDFNKGNDSSVLGSEKLNLDRSSGDDFMEEEGIEVKQVESKPVSDELSFREKEMEASDEKEQGIVDIVGEDNPDDLKVASVEEKNGAALPPAKRKLDDQKTFLNGDTTKKQRRWFSEQRNDDVDVTPKGAIQPALKTSFSRSVSALSQEAPKKRIVPPSSKAPTSALRIDRFLRPFTLKAVQELLGKTGTVTDFWMDNIKTHCYVSYSFVEEAVETRNAVYNLQWPPNGGRLLVAEYVDPLEVKTHMEPPPPPPTPQAPAATASFRNPGSQPPPPTQPSPRLQVQKQPAFLPPPPPLPPLAISPGPATMDQQPIPVKERLTLPPLPPLPEKADPPPILTLDDLFRKTKATPRIYYLPLTEEQVADKLEALGKTDNQYAGMSCLKMFAKKSDCCRKSWFVEDGFMVFLVFLLFVKTEVHIKILKGLNFVFMLLIGDVCFLLSRQTATTDLVLLLF